MLTARVRTARLDLASPSSAGYLRSLATAQRQLAARITATIPQSSVTWHYQVVLNGLAVFLPRADLARLAATPGVAKVWPNVAYRPLLDRSPQLIGAPQMWGSDFSTAGNGVKIGIVDDGVDQAHPFFNPAGYTMPPGFPKGNVQFTTPKVIAARAFSPPTNTWKYAKTPFDPEQSEHATHVAGIAAGNYSPGAIPGRGPLSGVAPRAYLGNYKVLTVPTTNFGLNGNAPEIAAGIEAAVRDGMDVINLSLGEAEIEPSRDLVVAAINAAADAGVVPVIAAGNDFDEFGDGSVSSPGSAAKAITAAAVTKQLADRLVLERRADARSRYVMKPDVSAPGVDITSSVPPHAGTWASFSGTSMAAPHVAGAVALLLQRHPDWTVAQIKSALVITGKPVARRPAAEVPTTREGGGLINVPAANDPLIFAAPADLSFGLLKPSAGATRCGRPHRCGRRRGHVGGGRRATGRLRRRTVAAPSTRRRARPAGRDRDRSRLAPKATSPASSSSAGHDRPADPLLVPGQRAEARRRAARHARRRRDVSRARRPASRRSSTRIATRRPGRAYRARTGPSRSSASTLRAPVANFGVVVTGRRRRSPRASSSRATRTTSRATPACRS